MFNRALEIVLALSASKAQDVQLPAVVPGKVLVAKNKGRPSGAAVLKRAAAKRRNINKRSKK